MTFAQAADYLIESYPELFFNVSAEKVQKWWETHLISNITPYHLDQAVSSNKLPTLRTEREKPITSAEQADIDLVYELGLYEQVYGRSDRIGI